MKGKRSTEEQIVAILKEAAAGGAPTYLCRRHGVAESTLDRWKAKYGDIEVSEVRRLKTLEDGNVRLKRLVANQPLDIQALRVAVSKEGSLPESVRVTGVPHSSGRCSRYTSTSSGSRTPDD